MKKVAIFLPSLDAGGVERVMVNLSSGFSKKDYVVSIVLASAKGSFIKRVQPGIAIYDLKASRVLKSIWGLMRYLRRERPDILLSGMEHSNFIAYLASLLSLTKTKVILSVHTDISRNIEESKNLTTRLTKYWISPAYKNCDGIIAVSEGVLQSLLGCIGTPKGVVSVIYNPVLTEDIPSLSLESINHPWFVDTRIPIVIAVGNLNAAKDYPTLIESFSIALKKTSARLLILGEGSERKNLEKMIQRKGLGESVCLYGFAENPYKFLRNSSLYVMSSIFEGFGNALVEAIACGLPVIATNCHSGPSEILGNGRFGVLTPVGNVELLAEAILKNLGQKQHPGALSYINDRFSLASIINEYDAFIDEVLAS